MNALISGTFKYNEKQINFLEKLGLTLFFMDKESDELPLHAETIDIVICNWLFIYHDIKMFKNLKYIQLLSAGLDRVPVSYINERNIKLHNARGVYSIPMAEYAVCGVLQIMKQTHFFFENQKNKRWIKNRNIKELSDCTVGIVGFGSVGSEVAKKFQNFAKKIIAFDINDSIVSKYDVYNISNLDKMLKEINILVFTVPITEKTKGFFDYSKMLMMPQEAIIVNISRGGVIVEDDLLRAIKEKKLLGAVLDVFENEPLVDDAIWECDNIIVTPHVSFISDKNNERMWKVIKDNLMKFINIR